MKRLAVLTALTLAALAGVFAIISASDAAVPVRSSAVMDHSFLQGQGVSAVSRHYRSGHGEISRGTLALFKADMGGDDMCEGCYPYYAGDDCVMGGGSTRCMKRGGGCCSCRCVFYGGLWPIGTLVCW